MKVFTAEQIRAWDAYTIEQEPIESIELMNRASGVFAEWFRKTYSDHRRPIFILAGPGNNGGDGIAVARLLHREFYEVKVWLCGFGAKYSTDFEGQLKLLPGHDAIDLIEIEQGSSFPEIPEDAIVIDALFGSGLSRALDGEFLRLVRHLNSLPVERVSIDIPSGLYADRYTDGESVHAHRTLSFQAPKRAFFFPENAQAVGEWESAPIGLHSGFESGETTDWHYLTGETVSPLVKSRDKFSHKGTYGHALLISGSYGKMGATVLAAGACLRSGVGLLTVHAPRIGNLILQTAVPEAMFSPDKRARLWTSLPPELSRYNAIGVGPGIGTEPETAAALELLLQNTELPAVLDADALNILASNPALWRRVPQNSILTPHPKEFERLFGKTSNSFERIALLQQKTEEYGVFIVLKGAHSAIACPDGSVWFNSTGNPGMATGGSGDVLTGILTGLLAQGYTPLDAARLGVYLHGAAGDAAVLEKGESGLTAGDLVECIGKVVGLNKLG